MDKESREFSCRVFIVGAGFSHHLSRKRFPLGNALYEIVRKLGIRELERHFQECSHELPHLEEVLTRFELDRHINRSKKENIKKEIFKKVQENLTVKSLESVDFNPSKSLVKELFDQNDVIITTNYDLLLDHLLDSADLWSPLGNGYGCAIEVDNFKNEKIKQNLKNIRLLKIHGSFNFFQQELVSGGMSELISVLVNERHPDYLDRHDLFSKSAKYIQLGVDSRAENLRAIVLPTYIKPFAPNRTAMKIWHEAQEAMRHASVVSIIGYSFPEPDQMMSFLMSCPDANEFSREGRKLKINILNTKPEIYRVRNHIKRCLRANPQVHVDWKKFALDMENPDQAYKNLIASLKDKP